MQNKNGKKSENVDTKARDYFAKIRTSKVKIIAGLNMNGERIKVIKK